MAITKTHLTSPRGKSHPIQSHSIQCHPIQCHPIQSHLIQSHPIQSHPSKSNSIQRIDDERIGTWVETWKQEPVASFSIQFISPSHQHWSQCGICSFWPFNVHFQPMRFSLQAHTRFDIDVDIVELVCIDPSSYASKSRWFHSLESTFAINHRFLKEAKWLASIF